MLEAHLRQAATAMLETAIRTLKKRGVRQLVVTSAILLLLPVRAAAQDTDPQHRLQGYAFLAPSVIGGHNGVDTGGGGDAFFLKGFGAEAEISYFGPHWTFCTGCADSGMGLGSLDLIYRLPLTGRRIEPFAAGGYTCYVVGGGDSSHSYSNGYNLGGGVNIWLRKHLALRLDVRYQGDTGNIVYIVSHFVAFRIGVTVR
jgi:hypothetical protein